MVPKWLYTLMGICSLVIWSSNTYLYKMMIGDWGYFTGNAIMYILAGITGLIIHIFTQGFKFTQINNYTIPIFLFLNINYIALSLAFAFAKIGSEILQITIVNYMWTIVTYIMLIYFLDYKIVNKILFGIAILCAFFGICIACIGFNFQYLSDFFVNVQNDWYCYLFALCVVFAWSLYNVYIKKYPNEVTDDHIYTSFIVSGLFFLMLSFIFPKYGDWLNIKVNWISVLVLIYEALIATLLPYYLWNIGYKYGDELIISRFSLLSPILNVTFTSIFYKLSLYVNIFMGSFLLIVSAYLCKISVSNAKIQNLNQLSQNDTCNVENINPMHLNIVMKNCINDIENINPMHASTHISKNIYKFVQPT
jgi:drug/metabolite transporter (DMT)-like permease